MFMLLWGNNLYKNTVNIFITHHEPNMRKSLKTKILETVLTISDNFKPLTKLFFIMMILFYSSITRP